METKLHPPWQSEFPLLGERTLKEGNRHGKTQKYSHQKKKKN